MSQNEEIQTPAAAEEPTEPAEAVPETEAVSAPSENPEPAQTAGIRIVNDSEETPSGLPVIRRVDEEAALAQTQTQAQPRSSTEPEQTSRAPRGRTTRGQGRDDRAARRRVLSPVAPVRRNNSRFVRDQKTAVPTVASLDRTHTSDYSRAYITRRLTVRSNRAQIHFERHYDRVDYALQILTGVISEIASDSYAEQIENEVTSIFKTFEDNIDKAIESTAAMARKRGISERNARSEYDRPRTYETPIRSPFSVRYLNLIEKYDLINAALDCLWLNGYMATRVHVQSTGLWETRFRRLSTDLNNLRIRALREAAEESNRRMRAGDEEIRREARRAVDEKEGAASREAAEPKNESAETQGAVDKAD